MMGKILVSLTSKIQSSCKEKNYTLDRYFMWSGFFEYDIIITYFMYYDNTSDKKKSWNLRDRNFSQNSSVMQFK